MDRLPPADAEGIALEVDEKMDGVAIVELEAMPLDDDVRAVLELADLAVWRRIDLVDLPDRTPPLVDRPLLARQLAQTYMKNV